VSLPEEGGGKDMQGRGFKERDGSRLEDISVTGIHQGKHNQPGLVKRRKRAGQCSAKNGITRDGTGRGGPDGAVLTEKKATTDHHKRKSATTKKVVEEEKNGGLKEGDQKRK